MTPLALLREMRRAVVPTLRIAIWVFVTITVLLSAWVALGWAIAGWSPVVITSGSMEPTVGVGDVLLIDRGSTAVGQRSIIVFDRDGGQVAHRVFAVDGESLITKGDANPTPDTERVQPGDVVGVGRLVVPMIGLPLVWWRTGAWLYLAIWALLVIGGAIRMAETADGAVGRRRSAPPAASGRHGVGRLGIQRVRILIAILVGAQYVIGSDHLGFGGRGLASFASTAGTITVLLLTNAFGTWGERVGRLTRTLALGELAVDTVLVVGLAMSTGSAAFTWVLFSLPIIEAAVRFRLVGALAHWMFVTVVTLAARIWQGARDPSVVVLDDLEQLVDQLSVLFLVVVPAAYLAEQLIGEVATWQDATGQAQDRSQLLVRVANIGRDIVRLDGARSETILQGTRSLGFDHADLVVENPPAGWHVATGDTLPAPGAPGSGLVHAGELATAFFVDAGDPDAAEAAAIAEHGLAALVGQVVGDRDGQRVVLRAAIDAGRVLTPELVEAFLLLAGQATVAMRNEQLVTEITSMHEELEHRALHDPLTGLPNRAMLLQRLAALPRSGGVALLFLDLDGFKPVNDRLGHDVGDVLLQQVAARLLATVPRGTTVARLGGDEFTLVVPGCADEAAAREIAAAVAGSIGEPFDVERDVVGVTVSTGIAFGGEGVGDAELIRRADVAMYEAKHGRSATGIAVYRTELDIDAARRAALAGDFPSALAAGDIAVVFQPVFDVRAADRVDGAEALVRWRHPAHGDIAPLDIIETARSADLLTELNRHITTQACLAAAGWRAINPARRCWVAVNASPEELADDELVDHVREALDVTGLPVDWLYIEISERLVSPPSDRVLANVSALRRLGVGLLLDDFGQGNTSLSYLHELPLSGVKIDRRLVVNALRSENDRIVLHSIVDLSRQLGHLVIAEGIETAEHLDAVLASGCTLAQGFHLGRPQPSSGIGRLVWRELRPGHPSDGRADVVLGDIPARVPTAALPPPVAAQRPRSDPGSVVV